MPHLNSPVVRSILSLLMVIVTNFEGPQMKNAGAMSKMAFQDFKPMIDKSFEAKVTDVFHYGYSVETNIDGKQLRGLLFSYKPGYYSAVHNHLTK